MQSLPREDAEQKGEELKNEFGEATKALDAVELRKKAPAIRKSNPDKAIDYLSQAIQMDPHHPRYYNNRGNLWKKKGDFDRAMIDYSKAIDIDPQYGIAYNN